MESIVEIEDLYFEYSDGQQALKGVCLTIHRGEQVALIGPNGAGKSTLLLHLNGILRGGRGRVKIFGLPVEGRNLKLIRRKVGLVFQNPDDQLFSPTVFDDVAFGPLNMGLQQQEVHRRVAQALEWVGLPGYERRSPHHLSLGERKRVALATVLSMSPELLVLDEPTGNLDPRSKWSLIRLLQRLPMSKIIASHDLELVAAVCWRAVLMDAGKIVADQPVESVLADLSLLREHGLAPLPVPLPLRLAYQSASSTMVTPEPPSS
jgi:cobalt/nickel transport system ATP-binding protein